MTDPMRPQVPTPSGLLIIDKHKGPTSMQVCAAIRARLRRGGAPKRIKVGHAGTLDPLATGVLVVLVGSATKRVSEFMGQPKAYDAVIDLSGISSTDDAEGTFTAVIPERIPGPADIEAVLPRFVGTIMQCPPAFSAVHIDGQRAYDLARAGKEVAIPARAVVVHAIRINGYDWPTLRLSVDCGKGTYIRSLARDLGSSLGCGGYLTDLRRTAVGECTLVRACPLDALPAVLAQSDLLPVEPLPRGS